MTPSVVAKVLNFETSKDLWSAIEQLYDAANCSRINQLRASLQTSRKGNMRMEEYLAMMKEIFENLALAGEPIPNTYLISSVLAGLDSEYLPIICQINSQEAMSWQTFRSTMLTFENTLLQMNIITNDADTTNPTTNLVATRTNLKQSNPTQGRCSGRDTTTNNNFRGQGRNRGRGGRLANWKNNSRVTCQVCNKLGHSVAVCYYRYDDPNNSRGQENKFATSLATPDVVADESWYADSGATNNTIAELGNLTIQSEYGGQANREGGHARGA